MKKSYRKLLILQIIILFIMFVLNSFMPSILNDYKLIGLLIITIIVFKICFGLEKDHQRYTKDILLELLIAFMISFIIYYLAGLITGYTRIDNYYNWYGLKTFIIPIALKIILKEYLRYNMVKKSEGSKLLNLTTLFLFIMMDIIGSVSIENLGTTYKIFLFIALYILPTISNNVLCHYLTKKVGYKPCIIFLIIIRLYYYLIPVIPTTNEYIESLIGFLFPLFILYRLSILFSKEKDADIESDYNKKHFGSIITLLLFTGILVYFTSGYFHYYAVSIGSGSMEPFINVGDAIVIEKIDDDYELKVNDIIAFKYDNTIIVHRINKIEKDKKEYFYYTKGDANENLDAYPVKKDMIIGIVNIKIPYLGLPAVWLNNL